MFFASVYLKQKDIFKIICHRLIQVCMLINQKSKLKGLISVRFGELNIWVSLAASFRRFLFVIRSERTWFNLSSAQFEPLSVNDIISECRWWHLLVCCFFPYLDPEENSIEQRCLSFGKKLISFLILLIENKFLAWIYSVILFIYAILEFC